MPLATINAIWIGPHMGPIHAACLRSFLLQGHRVLLHVYDEPDDAPAGVELTDAERLLPRSSMIRHERHNKHRGSLAIFADLMRYEILQQELGVYVDCDVFCLKPLEDAPYIFGAESHKLINNAVLKLPVESKALQALRRMKDDRAFIPPWFKPERQLPYRIRAAIGMPVKLQKLPWASTGPRALTWFLRDSGEDRYAQPIDAFYPMHLDQTMLLTDPGLTPEELGTHRTRLLHLYNEQLKKLDLDTIAETSPLGRILQTP